MSITLTVSAPNRGYTNCPMRVAVDPASLPEGLVELVDNRGVVLPVQVEREGDAASLCFMLASIAHGETRKLRLRSADGSAPVAVGLEGAGHDVNVTIFGEPFTTVHTGKQWSKPFLHPLIGPSGPITRAYPMEEVEGETHDHPHHKGCWVAWGDVNGSDIWAEHEGHGVVQFESASAVTHGPAVGTLTMNNRWLDKEGNHHLDEVRTYRFYPMPASARAFDLSVTLTAANGDVKLGDTKEGGICSVRVATTMDVGHEAGGGWFTNGHGGVNEAEGWGKRAPWCDYCGPVNGKTVGIAIFDHPTNFRFPTYWHVRNYGLMTANPFGLSYFAGNPGGEPDGSVTLANGESLTFKYRVFIHAGDTTAGGVADAYAAFAYPPDVVVGTA